MLFVAKLGIFRIQQELSKSKSNLIPFIKTNHCPERLSKSFPTNYSKKFCLLLGKWLDLTWFHRGPTFSQHHLWEISLVYKIAVLTPKSDIYVLLHMDLQHISKFCQYQVDDLFRLSNRFVLPDPELPICICEQEFVANSYCFFFYVFSCNFNK